MCFHPSGQIITTSAEVTLNGGLIWELPQNPLNSGLGIILICPDPCFLFGLVASERREKEQHSDNISWKEWNALSNALSWVGGIYQPIKMKQKLLVSL